ncbi:tetraspanin-3-like [Penaeus japonicus]|uniref:tetraspanin-3-like n=1 Tax=Penaeus japonicus TaxID=27405 RepID=UPI001C7163AA|nr:tetraspanin-3-like [Penaeus japonicus]
MGCFSRYALFVLNFVVFGVGVATIVLASIFLYKNHEYSALLASGIFTLPICILIVGICILLLGFFGCCGALKENSCMLNTYAAILLLLLVAEVVFAILLFVYTEETEAFLNKSMKEVFKNYGKEDQALTNSLDAAQQELHCCGVDGYQDWSLPEFYNSSDGSVAKGCCIKETIGCNMGLANASEEIAAKFIYTQGCYQAIKEDVENVVVALGVTTLILGLIQLGSVSCACGLANNSK